MIRGSSVVDCGWHGAEGDAQPGKVGSTCLVSMADGLWRGESGRRNSYFSMASILQAQADALQAKEKEVLGHNPGILTSVSKG